MNRGRFNFDEVRYLYYRDRAAELLALQAGEFDLREEFTAVAWVTGYDVPAVKAGKLVRLTLPDESPSGAQGFFLNTRRPKLADVRVRKALDYVFDFEFANKIDLPRALYAHRELLRELPHEGDRQAERRGACAAGAVQGFAAAGGVR